MWLVRSGCEDARAVALAVVDASWARGAEEIKREQRTSVRRGEALGREAVVKTWAWTRLKDWLNALLGRTAGQRHWRGAERLKMLGVESAACLALVRRLEGFGVRETLVLEALRGKTLLEHLDELKRGVSGLSFAERCALAEAVGAQVKGMTTRGWFNRDHKPSNLIVVSPERVAVIDTVAIKRDRERTGGARMLTSLMLEPMGVGCAASRTMRMRALIAASGGASLSARKMAWRGIAERIAAHGDPRPRINPLTSASG